MFFLFCFDVLILSVFSSFNLLYLFILVMRNNIMIVESFVLFCFYVDIDLMWLYGIYKITHKTDTQLQSNMCYFLHLFLRPLFHL